MDASDILSKTKFIAPSPSAITLLAGQLRNIVAGLGAIGVFAGVEWSDAKLTAISAAILSIGGGLLWIATGVWSAIQKYKSTADDHAGSVASATISANESAKAGEPVVVVVPPPPSNSP